MTMTLFNALIAKLFSNTVPIHFAQKLFQLKFHSGLHLGLNRKIFSRTVFFIQLVVTVIVLTDCSNQVTSKTTKTEHARHHFPAITESLNAMIVDSLAATPNQEMQDLTNQIRENPTNADLIYAVGYHHMQLSASGKNTIHHDLAIRYFNEALKLVPGNSSLLRALYNIYYEDTARNRNPNAFESAREVFFQLPESSRKDLNPPSLAKYAIMEAWFENQKKMNRPVLRRLLLDALQEQSANETALILLAKQYSDEKYYSLAIATLKLGLERLPNNAEILTSIAETYEGKQDTNSCSYEHPSDIDNAVKYYKLAIAQSSDVKSLHYGLSRALLDKNLIQLALNEADITLAIEATAETLSANAERYAMLGQFDKSKKLLQQALDKGYKISDPGYHEMMMNQGDWQNARKGFAAYLNSRKNASVYDFIKNDIIAQESHQPPLAIELKLQLNSTWEENLNAYWNKKKSDAELKATAKNRCERTEYFFYTGYRDYSTKEYSVAKSKFTETIKQNTYRFIERPLARYFLTR